MSSWIERCYLVGCIRKLFFAFAPASSSSYRIDHSQPFIQTKKHHRLANKTNITSDRLNKHYPLSREPGKTLASTKTKSKKTLPP